MIETWACAALVIPVCLFAWFLIKFAFNPLGLSSEPGSALPPEFFETFADTKSLSLLCGGQSAFPAVFKAIDNAEQYIIVQTFIWRADDTGRAIAQKLADAAGRGVKISINKDALGTFFELGDIMRGQPGPVFADTKLKRNKNVTISVSPFKDRDHSKYFIIDGRAVIFGGMNIADEYHYKWHDYMIKLDDPRLARAFERRVLHCDRWPTNAPFYITANDRKTVEIRTALIQVIDNAREKITLQQAYFSDDRIINALARAVKRGVKVEVILPRKPATHRYANMDTINRLLALGPGVDVYLYSGMTHAKAMLVDSVISAVGSANLTVRSMRNTREVTMFVRAHPDDPFIASFTQSFEAVKDQSERVVAPFALGWKGRLGALTGKYAW